MQTSRSWRLWQPRICFQRHSCWSTYWTQISSTCYPKFVLFWRKPIRVKWEGKSILDRCIIMLGMLPLPVNFMTGLSWVTDWFKWSVWSEKRIFQFMLGNGKPYQFSVPCKVSVKREGPKQCMIWRKGLEWSGAALRGETKAKFSLFWVWCRNWYLIFHWCSECSAFDPHT